MKHEPKCLIGIHLISSFLFDRCSLTLSFAKRGSVNLSVWLPADGAIAASSSPSIRPSVRGSAEVAEVTAQKLPPPLPLLQQDFLLQSSALLYLLPDSPSLQKIK